MRIFKTANLLTSLRIVLLPLLVFSETRKSLGISFILLIIIGLSDVFDGLFARWENNATYSGAVYDMAADFAVIGILVSLFTITKTFPLYLLILTALSFVSFCGLCVLKKMVFKNKIGRFAGTVMYSGLLILFFVRLFLKHYYTGALNIIIIIFTFYLTLTIIENSVLLFRELNKKLNKEP